LGGYQERPKGRVTGGALEGFQERKQKTRGKGTDCKERRLGSEGMIWLGGFGGKSGQIEEGGMRKFEFGWVVLVWEREE
jgi:hypothetical protein